MTTGGSRRLASLIGLALLLGGCGSESAVTTSATANTQTTVVVRTGDISSVVTLDANVIARPTFVITAHTAGTIHLMAAPDVPREQSTTVGWIGSTTNTTWIELPPFAGFVGWLARDGDQITAGLPIITAYYSGLAVEATIPDDSLYRFYGQVGAVQAEIYHGPGPFDCPELGDLGVSSEAPAVPAATAGTAETAEPVGISSTPGGVVFVCETPRDLQLFAGMRGVIAVTTAEASGVLALPVEAVAGSSQRGLVTLVHSDVQTESRTVELGITDGVSIEIKSGLQAGDVVAVPGPFLQGMQPQ